MYRKGDGPSVVVITEMPGISPLVLGFADRVVALGCSVVVPDLFGTAGRDPTAGGKLQSAMYMMRSIAGACISREFTVLATGRTSPRDRVAAGTRCRGARPVRRAGRRRRRNVLHGRLRAGDGGRPARRRARALAAVAPAGRHERRKSTHRLQPGRARHRRRPLRHRGSARARVCGSRAIRSCRRSGSPFFASGSATGSSRSSSTRPTATRPSRCRSTTRSLTGGLIDEPGEPTRDALDQVLALFRRKLVDVEPSAGT